LGLPTSFIATAFDKRWLYFKLNVMLLRYICTCDLSLQGLKFTKQLLVRID